MAGGLGGLGGFINSPTGGNMLQALGMSLMSSPRNAPLANFGQFYGGLQDRQMRQDALDQERADVQSGRDARMQLLIAAKVPEQEARAIAVDPATTKIRLEQIAAERAAAKRDAFMSSAPNFGSLGSLGGIPATTGASVGGDLSLPGVSDAHAPEIERMPLPAPTQTQLGLRGAAQLDPHNFNVGQTPPDDRALEPVVDIPQEPAPAASGSGNQTMTWLEKNHPEVAALVTPDSGITPRDAFEIAQVRQKTMSGAQPAAQQAPQQSQLDQLYQFRDQYATWAAGAPDKDTYDVAKRRLDVLDNQIARLEAQSKTNTPKVTDDIAEYKFAVSQGYSGTLSDFMKEMKQAGATSVNVGAGEKAWDMESAKLFAKRYDDITAAAGNAQQMMGMYDLAEQALNSGVRTGMGADAELTLRQLGAAMGMDTDPEKLAGGELIRAVQNRMALTMRSPDGGMGMPGALSDRDIKFLKDSQVGIDRSPEGNRRMLEAFRAMERRKIEISQLADQYVQDNGRLDAGFNRAVREYANANPLFAETVTGPARPTSDDEYNALPSGTTYIDPDDGKTYRKP